MVSVDALNTFEDNSGDILVIMCNGGGSKQGPKPKAQYPGLTSDRTTYLYTVPTQ